VAVAEIPDTSMPLKGTFRAWKILDWAASSVGQTTAAKTVKKVAILELRLCVSMYRSCGSVIALRC
jgi:hypothetical protein